MVRTNLVKVGDSYYLPVSKKFIDVYEMFKWLDDYDFEVSMLREGKTITYTRVKKDSDNQKKLNDYEKKK